MLESLSSSEVYTNDQFCEIALPLRTKVGNVGITLCLVLISSVWHIFSKSSQIVTHDSIAEQLSIVILNGKINQPKAFWMALARLSLDWEGKCCGLVYTLGSIPQRFLIL